jgi:O-antigen/teichoic acid export membrane protein
MVGGLFFTISSAASLSMFAEGAHDPDSLAQHQRGAIRLTAALLVPVSAGALLLGPMLLGLFGKGYAEDGWPILAVLIASAVPDAVTNIGMARWRVTGELVRVAVLQATIATVCIAAVWIFVGAFGPVGLGYGWLTAQCCGSVMVLVWNRVRPSGAAVISTSEEVA